MSLLTTTIATPTLWVITVAGVLALVAFDFLLTRRPHDVSMREALGWSGFYIALPLLFGVWVWQAHGSEVGLEFYTGYLVEKTLSVDNLFIFILILSSFAVPRVLQQRVLLIGIVGALILRAAFIALGAVLIAQFSWMFLIFGAILLVTAWGVLRDARHGGHSLDVSELRLVRLARRWFPVTDDYRGTRLSVSQAGRRALTPLALVVIAILGTDVVFAVDSVPAVYGITGDPYLVFVTNAFALLGLRALYFVLEGALAKLRHLGFGLAFILAFIGVKLGLHWAHGVWSWVPSVPTLASLVVIVVALAVVTATSLIAERREHDGARIA
ncbi:TerC/Alx family metal homeostasis membrane protein [Propioniciclava tarda]|uniref:TerC/Alx family metal homeostasis membrane protein n=1 Tax=Propioniciclava tarda TaxID=433330 RepID=A0A4Q9KKM2_PROTD|nr:TerC/Alx family metal homeostasis membrane protein [Propioniciclava tarda]TBT94735.1 TerC/Alx family metal homeostasis membrane protein [Propioniciclava tarda]SMO64839.1 integral membrane protein, TerC family [Propioniciclava tarda]